MKQDHFSDPAEGGRELSFSSSRTFFKMFDDCAMVGIGESRSGRGDMEGVVLLLGVLFWPERGVPNCSALLLAMSTTGRVTICFGLDSFSRNLTKAWAKDWSMGGGGPLTDGFRLRVPGVALPLLDRRPASQPEAPPSRPVFERSS